MSARPAITIRSYRSVFRFERRVYRIDQWRLPVRGGVPLRALVYLPAVFALLALAARVPLFGAALAALPAPLHWGLLPLGLTVAALRLQLDGRPPHRALWSLARFAFEPRWLAGLRPCPSPAGQVTITGVLVVRPDLRGARRRAGRLRGPVRVRLTRTTALVAGRSRRRLTVEPADGPPLGAPRVLEVPAGAELVVR